MATSDVSISNLALQKLGAVRITALSENSRNARSCNACYEAMRDLELRAHPWNFAITRTTLAAAGTAPAFDYLYAFPVPNDFLRLILPPHFNLDWRLERQDGVRCILTNDTDALQIRYIQRITDPTEFDPCFVELLACRMGVQMCEEITQSNEKKQDIEGQYKNGVLLARRANAFEKTSMMAPEDSWLVAQRADEVPFIQPT